MTRPVTLALFLLVISGPVAAQPAAAPSAPKTYDMRDDASQWINDPNVHAFYQATVEAFAQGPEHVDREAYMKRTREIFTAFAMAHGMPVDQVLNHVKGIPDEVLVWAARDPHTLDSYDNFAVALFGPQKPPTAP